MTINQIFILGFLFRFFILIILAIWPFNHVMQGDFGPLSYQNADRDDYLFALDLLLLKKENIDLFLSNYLAVFKLNFSYDFTTITGPLFPIILGLTKYSLQTPYYLALLCFLSEVICFYLWINYFEGKMKTAFILIFAFMPIPLMFSYIHSTEVFFYLFSTIILIQLIKFKKTNNLILLLLFLSLMLRPASIALIITIYLYFLFFNKNKIPRNHHILLIIMSLIAIFFYLPYFVEEINKDKVMYPNYFDDIFILHHELVEISIVKSLIITLLKFFFLFGFDPTESGYPIIQGIRSLLGIIFIIGFFKTFLFKSIKIELIYIWVTVFFISIFFYPTYRYIIPIIPFLYLYFFQNIKKNSKF